MKNLEFYLNFARLQAYLFGGAVSVKQYQTWYGLSRTMIYRYLNRMMLCGHIRKIGHGKYILCDHIHAQSVGLCTLSQIDMMEYSEQYHKHQISDKKSA